MSIFKKRSKPASKYGWFGNYNNWNELVALSDGYEASLILEKTKKSLLKIKNGDAIYERDSVLFDKKLYPFSIISALLYSAIDKNNSLNVIDFGGSLGSTYYQVRDFIPSNISVNWNVVEQNKYVTCGQEYFEDEILKFHYTIDDSIENIKPHVLLLSGVVQYLENPHEFLKMINQYEFDYILIDRTAFISGDLGDRLTLQVVPPEIYEAKYPSWFFNEKKFLEHFSGYDIMVEFEPYVVGEQEIQIDGIVQGYDKGFFLVRKK